MTVHELQEACGLSILICEEPERLQQEITGCYIGDFLSWAMGKIAAGNVWITVMGNVNALAVAALTDAACIILAEGASLDEEAVQKAKQQGILVLAAEQSSYQLAVRIGERLN
ncbi:MAG: hypothetical protein HFJ84_02150 [Clostridiales bacterium]|jgi:predicted transcriptional regulator|nr:hypothetical protein [Clostridiales bacterium]